MSSNKSAKEALIRLYGAECFIEKLHLRPDKERRYKGKAQYTRMKQLTYHHITEKSKGGKATVENGALLSAENHTWFNKQSKDKQRQLNEIFQEYKRVALVSQITTEGIKKVEILDIPEVNEDYIEIEAEETTQEDRQAYEEYKRKRFTKELQKPIWKNFKGDERE